MEIVRILWRHCRFSGLDPVRLREMLEELGPTFVKAGQLLSSRPDVLPAAYCDELAKLRVKNEPMPFSQVRAVLEEEFDRPLQEIFSSFDEDPLGSASIAQVHAAVLRSEDGRGMGKAAAVKVQRPGIYDTMSQDIALLKRAAKIVKPLPIGKVIDFETVLDEIWAVAREEMDFCTEAKNAERFAENCREIAFATCPHIEHASAHVLVMERVEGIPIGDTDALDAAGYDRNDIGEKLSNHYIRQVLDDGFFHADPHSGNLLIHDGKIIWLDFGMMGRLSLKDRKLMRDAVRAVAMHDVEGLVSAVLAIGVVQAQVDYPRLYRDIEAFLNRYGALELGDMNLSQVFGELMDLAMSHRIALPKGVSMLGRGMVTLEGVLANLSPDISLLRIVENRMSEEARSDDNWKEKLQDQGRVLFDAVRGAVALPAQVSCLLRMAERGQLKVITEQTVSSDRRSAEHEHVRCLSLAILAAGLLVASGLFSGMKVATVAGLPWPSFVCGLSGLCMAAAAVLALFQKRK